MKLVIFSSCHTFIELFHWYLRMALTFLFKSAFLWHSLHQCNWQKVCACCWWYKAVFLGACRAFGEAVGSLCKSHHLFSFTSSAHSPTHLFLFSRYKQRVTEDLSAPAVSGEHRWSHKCQYNWLDRSAGFHYPYYQVLLLLLRDSNRQHGMMFCAATTFIILLKATACEACLHLCWHSLVPVFCPFLFFLDCHKCLSETDSFPAFLFFFFPLVAVHWVNLQEYIFKKRGEKVKTQ